MGKKPADVEVGNINFNLLCTFFGKPSDLPQMHDWDYIIMREYKVSHVFVIIFFSQLILFFLVSVVSSPTVTQLILVHTLGIYTTTSKISDAIHGWMLIIFRVVII